MKIYIVLNSHIYHEGDEVMSAWTTEELANAEVLKWQALAKEQDATGQSFFYIEAELHDRLP